MFQFKTMYNNIIKQSKSIVKLYEIKYVGIGAYLFLFGKLYILNIYTCQSISKHSKIRSEYHFAY